MILDTFNSVIQTNMMALEEAKTKMDDAVDPKIKAKILEQLPSPESIKTQLQSEIPLETPEALKILESKFLKLKNTTNNLVSKVDTKIQQLEAIKSKINGINDNFTKLGDVINDTKDFVSILKQIILLAPAALSLLSAQFANGLNTIKINDGVIKAKGKLAEFDIIISMVSVIQPYIAKKLTAISDIVDPAINILKRVKEPIETNSRYIDNLFLQLIAPFSGLLDGDTITYNTPPFSNIPDSDPYTNQNDLENSPTPLPFIFNDPVEILNNLENSNKEKFIIFLKNEEGNTGYKIIK